MADDSKDTVVKQAEKFQPAHEETSKSLAGLADEYFRDLFSKAKIGSKDDDPYRFSGDGKKPGPNQTEKPADPYDYSGDGKNSDAKNAAGGLQKLFDKAADPKSGASKTENFQEGNGELRVLAGADGKTTGQYVDASGKTTTRINENTCVEYDPRSQKYSSIDKTGKRTELKDDDHVDPSDKNSKTLKELKEKGVAQEKADGTPEGSKATYLDGRVTTTFKEPSQLSERTTFPPGYRSDDPKDNGQNAGLRQVEKYRELRPEEIKPGDNATASSARTVKTFEDRKETSFDKGDISKVTAFKNPDRDHPAVSTDYRENKGPNGASSVDTYKNDDRPQSVKQVAKFHDANDKEQKPDKITFNNGVTADRPSNGDIRKPVGNGDRTGVLDIDRNNGMPTHMQIGDNDYKVQYGIDGKVTSMSVEGKGDPPSHLQLDRDAKTGELKVTTADGKFAPKDGKIDLDGIPINVKDGKVDGDVSMNKEGDIRYVGSGGPERHEIVRRVDGTKEDYDFKNWTKTTTGADGKVKDPVDRWDGYKWRDDGKPTADGTRVDFPDGTFTSRATSGDPPKDVTVFGSADGSTSTYDWRKGSRVDKDTAGKETKSYYDGSTYRQGSETALPNGDTSIQFAPPVNKDQPNEVVHHGKDNATTNKYEDGTQVEKNPKGQVTEINGPNGSTKITRDGDGDIFQVQQAGADGKKTTYTRSGQERDPGMEHWFGREGNGTPHQPSDVPPRDPNAPKDYNAWKTTTQLSDKTSVEYDPATKSYTRIEGDKRTALNDDNAKLDPSDPKSKTLGEFKKEQANGVNSDGMNIHTTADGTVRFESAPRDGKPAELRLRPPVGDSSSETATQKIVDHPGGIRETVDKTQTPPVSSVEFSRNGKAEKLSSANGPISFSENGTVEQKSVDGKTSTAYMPDGSKAVYANDGAKQTVTQLDIAANDPKNPGKVTSLKPGTDPCKTLEKSGDSFKAVMMVNGAEVPTVLDPIHHTKQEQLPGEKFNRVSDLTTGQASGLNDLNGNALLRYSADGKSAVGPDGKRQYSADKWDLDPSHIKAGPNGEPMLVGKNGKDKALFKASGAVVETVEGQEKTVYPNGREATFENGKLKSLKMGNKDFEPVLNDKGEVTSLKPKGGAGDELKAVPPGSAYTMTEDGRLVSDSVSETKDGRPGVTTHREWKPLAGQSKIERSFLAADKKTMIKSSFVTDKDGKVSEFSPPGAQDGATLSKPATYKDGKVTIAMDDKGSTISVNADGSSDLTRKGANGAPDQVSHRDRDNNLVPTDEQANNLKTLADAALNDTAQQQKFVNELMSRINTQQDLASFMKSLNDGVLKQAGITLEVKPGDAQNKLNIILTKGNKPVSISFTIPGA